MGERSLPDRPFLVPVRGITFRESLPAVDMGQRVELRREPSNPADPNAVAVFVQGGQLGYLPRQLAARMDDPERWRAEIATIYPPAPGRSAGLRLRLEPDDPEIDADRD